MNAFAPYLSPALQSYEDPQLCSVAVGLIGDICRALGEEAAPYCNTFMTVLLESLQSPVLDRQVKITIVSCFGDIAMSIGPNFEPYFAATMGVLRSAGEQTADPVSGTLDNHKWLLTVDRRIITLSSTCKLSTRE